MWHKPCRTFHPWCPCIKTRRLSLFYVMLVGLVPRVQFSGQCTLLTRSHPALTELSGTQGIQPCNLDPVPAACRISPIKHCRVAHTLKHIHHCRWWQFQLYIYFIYPKHDAVKILFCLDIGIWHPSLEYACCILLFATCSMGTLCIFEYLRTRDWQPIS